MLAILKDDLQHENFTVELGKKKKDQIRIPILFDKDGKYRKYFCLDALNKESGVASKSKRGKQQKTTDF